MRLNNKKVGLKQMQAGEQSSLPPKRSFRPNQDLESSLIDRQLNKTLENKYDQDEEDIDALIEKKFFIDKSTNLRSQGTQDQNKSFQSPLKTSQQNEGRSASHDAKYFQQKKVQEQEQPQLDRTIIKKGKKPKQLEKSDEKQEKSDLQIAEDLINGSAEKDKKIINKPSPSKKSIVQNKIDIKYIDEHCESISPIAPNETSREYLQEFLAENSNQNPYKDLMQPPNASLIFTLPLSQRRKSIIQPFNEWNQIAKFYPNKRMWLTRLIDPVQIQESPNEMTRNINILCTLAILAENSMNILNLLENQQYNQNGLYYVRLNKMGVWRFIIVDDFVAGIVGDCPQMTSYRLQDEKDQDVEIWPLIIEKALIKSYGTYEDLQIANTPIQDIMRDLTGGSIIEYSTLDDNILLTIQENLKQQNILVVLQNENFNKGDLFGKDQKFAIVGITNDSVQIRNPWGMVGESSKVLVNDSICTIKLTDFQQLFDRVLVVYPQSQQQYYQSIQVTQKNKPYNIIEFTIDNQLQKTFFEINQVDKRLLKKNLVHYEYGQMRIILFNKDTGYIDGVCSENQRYLYIIINKYPQGQHHWNQIPWNLELIICEKQIVFILLKKIIRTKLRLFLHIVTISDYLFPNIHHSTLSYLGQQKLQFKKLASQNLSKDFLNDLYAIHAQNRLGRKLANDQILLQENEKIVIITFYNKGIKNELITKDYSKACYGKLRQFLFVFTMLFLEKHMKIQIEIEPKQVKTVVFKLAGSVKIGLKTLKELGFK